MCSDALRGRGRVSKSSLTARACALLGVLLLGSTLGCGSDSGSDGSVPVVTAVEPACGDPAAATDVILRGAFPVKTEVPLGGGAPIIDTTYRAFVGDVELTNVAFSDPQTLTGTVPAGLPLGTYSIAAENALSQRGSLPDAFQVQEGGTCSSAAITLVTAAVAAPNGVTVGQRVTVTANVRNVGSNAASIQGVITPPANLFTPVSADAGPKDAAAGASVTFTWVFTATAVTAAEGITFSVDATGQDSAGTPVRAERVTTGAVLVSGAANLSLSAQADRASANVNQNIDYTLTVTNNGSAAATGGPGRGDHRHRRSQRDRGERPRRRGEGLGAGRTAGHVHLALPGERGHHPHHRRAAHLGDRPERRPGRSPSLRPRRCRWRW